MRKSPVSTNRRGFLRLAAFFWMSAVVSNARPKTETQSPTTRKASVRPPAAMRKSTGDVWHAYRSAAEPQMAKRTPRVTLSLPLTSPFIFWL